MNPFHIAAVLAIAGLIVLIAATIADVIEFRIKCRKRGAR